jgi:hypothetical protein
VKELLGIGQKEIVVQFFQSGSQFWDKAKCEKWINQIKQGKTPNFTGNGDIGISSK